MIQSLSLIDTRVQEEVWCTQKTKENSVHVESKVLQGTERSNRNKVEKLKPDGYRSYNSPHSLIFAMFVMLRCIFS